MAGLVKSGLILFISNYYQPRNYKSNPFPFRQDSSFFYYTGLNRTDLVFLIDTGTGEEWLSGYDPGIEDAIWSGPQQSLADLAIQAGIKYSLQLDNLKEIIRSAREKHRTVHFLPPYTEEKERTLADLIGLSAENVRKGQSEILIKAVVAQRSVKAPDEVSEIEKALDEVTGPMHIAAMKMAMPGLYEHQIVAEMYRIAKQKEMDFAYQVICSVRGETLHNESHRNKLQEGQLLLIDAGVESWNHYASDITRTWPVGGRFTEPQRAIYSIVLRAQMEAIKSVRPGVPFRDIHFQAAGIITEGLKELGLMKGDVQEAVECGAHALFFPHGLGHMLGLDVHDMEDLGEDYVGYGDGAKRSAQFGTAYLRLARQLQPGFVLTVEPGIYFIPELITKWKYEGLHKAFINFSALGDFLNFGGVRIEDNVLVTESGCRVLGKPIPKTLNEIEELITLD
ncbi:MAG: aminopeptidase P family protein [Bacteroidales bacterium]|nr:aminopeptidase P family protein [Bacteroidales bacterium]